MKNRPIDAPARLLAFLEGHPIDVEFVAPGVPMPTVPSAAAAIGVPEEAILKTLLFVDDAGNHVVAIANGTRRIDAKRLANVSGLTRLRAANPDAVEEITGYAAGGVAPIGLKPGVRVIVDEAVTALPVAYAGGGREHLLLRIAPTDIVRLNAAQVAPIVRPA
ncbi:MAG: YbaK/EbsC family protein [Thermomicrobiales bacterium]|nr:YbaK/EbsC family protein [Thermomicrobiales bacterium]